MPTEIRLADGDTLIVFEDTDDVQGKLSQYGSGRHLIPFHDINGWSHRVNPDQVVWIREKH